MFSLPKTICFKAIFSRLLGLRILSFALLGLALVGFGLAAGQAPANAAPGNAKPTEEIIEFEGDPELVGHTHEEKTSYADYEQRMEAMGNATSITGATGTTGPASGNATIPAVRSEPVKIVPPKGPQPTAMRLFRFIPPTIFDNTIEGMREDEKQLLMDSGETEFWVLTALTEDELVIENKAPEVDTQATLILFHAGNGDIVMAMGVTAGDSCALELWRYLADRRGITPMPMPDEPAVSDFFQTNRALPEDMDVSMLICLDPVEETLVAKPLIWRPSGLDPIVLDTKVIYKWDGNKFVKEVIPLN